MSNRVAAGSQECVPRITSRIPLRDFHYRRFKFEGDVASGWAESVQSEIVPAQAGSKAEFEQLREDEEVEKVQEAEGGTDSQQSAVREGVREGIPPRILSEPESRPLRHGRISEDRNDPVGFPQEASTSYIISLLLREYSAP